MAKVTEYKGFDIVEIPDSGISGKPGYAVMDGLMQIGEPYATVEEAKYGIDIQSGFDQFL